MRRKIFKRISDGIPRGNVIVVAGMLFLIFAQLIWWVIFFEINHDRSDQDATAYDAIIIAILNRETAPSDHPDLFYRDENGVYHVRPELKNRRDEEHLHNLLMLASETAFTLLVISYGSFRIIRSILRERRLIRERNIFLNSVTHELKTPLASILLNLQTLEKRELPPSSRNELIHEGIEGVRRLEEQINNLLLGGELLRNKTGQGITDPSKQRCDPLKVIKHYLQQNKSFFKKSHAVVTFAHGKSLAIAIHPDLFEKIVSNLVGNAIRYSGERPEVVIDMNEDSTHPRFALLSVSDNGPGIPPEELETIFKPLYRLEGKSAPVRGSGMGLYIVREIAESVGGDVRSFSGERGGSRFAVRLPIA